MTKTYALIDVDTGDIAHDKTYDNLRDAKLALRYHYGNRTHRYGIARITRIDVKLEWIVNEADEWTEVNAE